MAIICRLSCMVAKRGRWPDRRRENWELLRTEYGRKYVDLSSTKWRETDRYNKELYDMVELTPETSFVKSQKIQWLGHTIKRGEYNTTRIVLDWKPQGIRPGGRQRKRWLDLVKEYLKTLGIYD